MQPATSQDNEELFDTWMDLLLHSAVTAVRKYGNFFQTEMIYDIF